VCLEARRFEPAVAMLKTACQLDRQDLAAKENLLAALNNWALHECSEERFEKAKELIAEARAISPDFPPMLTNDLHVHQRWARHLCEEERFAEAIAILESARTRRPDEELFHRGPAAVLSLWAQSRFVAGDFDTAWKILNDASREPVFAESDAVAESAVCDACHELVERGDLKAAKRLMSDALQRLPAADELLRCQHDLLSDGS
jgi:tetratricopeptide (TPR) repeat protein